MPREARKTSIDYAARSPLPPRGGGIDDDFGKDLVNWLFPGYVTLIVLCVFLFLARGSMTQGHEMSFDRAVMASVNAATLTGFQLTTKPIYFRPFGRFLVLLLTVAGSLFSLIVGGMAVRRILRLDYSDRQITRGALICQAAALLIGVAGGCGYSDSLLASLTQGAAAFGNSGIEMGQPFALKAWQTHLIVLPMVTLGGLGITVLMELYDLLVHGKRVSKHAAVVLTWAVAIYVIAVAAFTVIQWVASDGPVNGEQFGDWLASGSIAAINSRTAGIPFQYAHEYRRPMQWAVIVLMMIGAGPAGTAGGLKTTTLATIGAGTRRLLRGDAAGTPAGARPLGIALAWLGVYVAIAFIGLIMLLFVQPQLAADRAVFLTISALSNVGLSHDTLPEMQRGAYVLAALMLAGRMVPLLILWWMADSTDGAELAVG